MKTLIIDLNQLAFAVKYVANDNYDLWRYIILKTIRKYNLQFKPTEIVLAVDGKHSWRKDVFKYYKANRNKEYSQEWTDFFNGYSEFVLELKEYFPYKCIQIEHAEGDDIIAILSQKIKDKIIISGDKDFLQLYIYDKNLIIWDPIKDEPKVCEDPERYLKAILLKGDSGDGVPNHLSDDDTFINESKRQKNCGDKKIDKIFEEGYDKYIDNLPPDIYKNYERNQKVINLHNTFIPIELHDKILYEYNNINPIEDIVKVSKYFQLKNMQSFFGAEGEFMIKNRSAKVEEKIDLSYLDKIETHGLFD